MTRRRITPEEWAAKQKHAKEAPKGRRLKARVALVEATIALLRQDVRDAKRRRVR